MTELTPLDAAYLIRDEVASMHSSMSSTRWSRANGSSACTRFNGYGRRIARRPGGRYGSASFVAGTLDPVRSRQEFLALARETGVPVMVVTAPQIPPRSRAEIEALAREPGVTLCHVGAGALRVHEEFPGQVAVCIRPFL